MGNSTIWWSSSKLGVNAQTRTTSSSATSLTEGTTPSKHSFFCSLSRSVTRTESLSSEAITRAGRSRRSTASTMNAYESTDPSMSGGIARKFLTTSPSAPSSKTRFSRSTAASAHPLTPSIRFASSTASRRSRTTVPCAISCGATRRKSTVGDCHRAALATSLAGTSSPCSTNATTSISSPELISLSWRATEICSTTPSSLCGARPTTVTDVVTSRRYWNWMKTWNAASRSSMRRRRKPEAFPSRIRLPITFCRQIDTLAERLPLNACIPSRTPLY
mmetsp:Transcript_13345/g.36875  ORF Transcript_13345/g.36875 Transcript_13345/m.36875 type:complete len:276 (-) Transcript_13345:674-1501(-)